MAKLKLFKNKDFAGRKVFSKNAQVNLYSLPGTKAVKAYKRVNSSGKVSFFGTLSSLYVKESYGTFYQIYAVDDKVYWANVNDITIAPAADVSAQKLISDLVENDEKILKNLVKSRALIEESRSKKTLTNEVVNKYNSLVQRHAARQNKIKSSKLLKVQTGISRVYNDLMTKLGLNSLKISGTDRPQWVEEIWHGEKIGVIPVVAWVIAAVVVAGASAAITAAFLGAFKESASDLVISKELEDLLSKTDPATAQAIKEDLQGQLDKAYSDGRASGSGSTMMGNLKTLGLVLLGAYVGDKLLNKK